MANILEKGFQGSLSTESAHLSAELSEDKETLTFLDNRTYIDDCGNAVDLTITYPAYSGSAGGYIKKLVVVDNNFEGNCIKPNMVIDSEASNDNSWTLESPEDGWYTSYLFYVEYMDADTIGQTIPIYPNSIFYWDNVNSDDTLAPTGFYVYTGTVSATKNSPMALDEVGDGTDYRIAGYEDWIEFSQLINGRALPGDFLGEFGITQHLVRNTVYCCMKELLLDTCVCDDDCIKCLDNDYFKVRLRHLAAEERFCQEEYAYAQMLVESLLQVCADNNCDKCK